MSSIKQFDVALSFAGEDREYVEAVASHLKNKGFNVFYDQYETTDLWGKNLYTHLQEVYYKQARYTIMFISQHYKEKLWTNHERESAQARAISEGSEYILPARFDDTEVPGLLPTVGYIRLNHYSPAEFAELLEEKIGSPKCLKRIPREKLRLGLRLGFELILWQFLQSRNTPPANAEIARIKDDITFHLNQDGLSVGIDSKNLLEDIAAKYHVADVEKHAALVLGLCVMTLNIAMKSEDSQVRAELIEAAYSPLKDIEADVVFKKDALFKVLLAASPIQEQDAADVIERHSEGT